MDELRVGDVYADKSAPGRLVQVMEVTGSSVTIETIAAAHEASTARAVGRQTHVERFSFRQRFALHAPIE